MKKVLSIILAIFMLASNTGLSLTTHYCGGRAVKSSIAFGEDDLSCGMARMNSLKCTNGSQESEVKRKNCCENRYITISVDDEFNCSDAVSTNIDHKFLTTLLVSYFHRCVLSEKALSSFTAYSPPLIKQDISVLLQVFRI